MKLFAASLAVLLVFPVAVQAQTTSNAAYRACMVEALKPITDSSAYRNGSVREKRALLNGYNAEVARRRAACRTTR